MDQALKPGDFVRHLIGGQDRRCRVRSVRSHDGDLELEDCNCSGPPLRVWARVDEVKQIEVEEVGVLALKFSYPYNCLERGHRMVTSFDDGHQYCANCGTLEESYCV